MPSEPNLTSAALNAYANMWVSTNGTNWLAFCSEALPFFPDDRPNNHPIANWLAVLSTLATTVVAEGNDPTAVELREAVSAVYRVCLLCNYLNGVPVSPKLISDAQAAALLAAYNSHL